MTREKKPLTNLPVRALACAGVAIGAAACGGIEPGRDMAGNGGEGDIADVADAFTPGLTCVTVREGQAGTIEDAYIDSAQPNANKGAASQIYVAKANAARRTMLLQWDVSFIPPDSNVLGSNIVIEEPFQSSVATLTTHRVTAPWDENTVTWANFGNAFDFASEEDWSNTPIYQKKAGFEIEHAVRDWVAGTEENNGVAVTVGVNSSTLFNSSEWPTVQQRPKWAACYIPPGYQCSNHVKDGDEHYIDCGGSVCPACQCENGHQDGYETGVDCGGVNPDAGGGVYASCAPCPSCDDGIQNQGEGGVDCGGPCPAACATCSDGIQNGGEAGVDCGGPCAPCSAGASCFQILQAGGSHGDGVYTLDPGGASPFQAYCDMTTEGGGWTLIATMAHGAQGFPNCNDATMLAAAATPETPPLPNVFCRKLSDAQINTVRATSVHLNAYKVSCGGGTRFFRTSCAFDAAASVGSGPCNGGASDQDAADYFGIDHESYYGLVAGAFGSHPLKMFYWANGHGSCLGPNDETYFDGSNRGDVYVR